MLNALTSALQPAPSSPPPSSSETSPSEEPQAGEAEKAASEPKKLESNAGSTAEAPAPKQAVALVPGGDDLGLAQARQYALNAQKAQAVELMIERISAPVSGPSLLEPYEAVPEALSAGATDAEAAPQQSGQRVDLRV